MSADYSFRSTGFSRDLNNGKNFTVQYLAYRQAHQAGSKDLKQATQKIEQQIQRQGINLKDGLQADELEKLGLKWDKVVDTYVDGIESPNADTPDGTITNKQAAKFFLVVDKWAQLKYQDKWQTNREESYQLAAADYFNSAYLGDGDVNAALARAGNNYSQLSQSGRIGHKTTVRQLLDIPVNEKEGTGFDPRYQQWLSPHVKEEFQKNSEDDVLEEKSDRILKDTCYYYEYLRMVKGLEEGLGGQTAGLFENGGGRGGLGNGAGSGGNGMSAGGAGGADGAGGAGGGNVNIVEGEDGLQTQSAKQSPEVNHTTKEEEPEPGSVQLFRSLDANELRTLSSTDNHKVDHKVDQNPDNNLSQTKARAKGVY